MESKGGNFFNQKEDLFDFCNFRSWFVLPCILPVCLGVSFLISMNSYYLSNFFFSTKTCKVEFRQNPNNLILKQNLGGEI